MGDGTKAVGEPLLRILHPSDFSRASRIAFAHALKIALLAKAELGIVHVQPHRIDSEKDVHWTEFPGVRSTLARWNILPADAKVEEVATTGLRIKKILNADSDPLEAMVRYYTEQPPDLLVLAVYQRTVSRWLHKSVVLMDEFQRDGKGDQENDHPFQHFHAPSRDLIGNFFIDTL